MTDKVPFCDGEASLTNKDERVGYDDYMRFVEFLYVENQELKISG